ncbi:enoyl-CoA hydratase/isomerase family protein [Paenarthrobacter sp. PH39-S1]|uniref:enoyl-CoA hydratase/isomerase family protein n=1 Tax=Paenarthrobacter sp. PH39-S1 TaxID=3046204 RepID=UPI0024B8F55F|nr:enoyl-CoA hydratase/isomerase family protein [Paenarthrobacter sp. PH39-S1]MDJ0355964.1 enoyl-CoA hydratase/isomerase family protein [Paenarthrobacter sp. PH39-S1]
MSETGSVRAKRTVQAKGTLRVQQRGPVATVLLENPGMRNAVTEEMWGQFEPVLARLDGEPSVKAVVVRGGGSDFSAGADIGALQQILLDPSTGHSDGGRISAAERALSKFRKPTIAAIDGYCMGGAWQIAGACDIRIASDAAVFGITPAKIGIVYPLSGIERLVRLVGPAPAKFLLFSGDFVDAHTALALGLVARVVPQPEFWADIDSFARRLASRSQLSIHAMKDLVDAIAGGAEDLAARNEFWQQEMAASSDPAEGVRAFLAKEIPEFSWLSPASRQPGS